MEEERMWQSLEVSTVAKDEGSNGDGDYACGRGQ